MKKWIFFATFMSLMSFTAKAQFDDVYYDPARDNRPTTATSTRPQAPQQRYDNNRTQSPYDDSYVDNSRQNTGGDYYEYDDEYDDYAYSSRIRRFHRPVTGLDYYNNAYVDYGYYEPNYYDRFFIRPSVTFVVGNTYWNRYNSYNRWNTAPWFNRYWNDWCYSSYGLYNPYSFYSAYSPFGYSGYSPFGYSSYYSPYGYGAYDSYGYGYGYNRYSNPYQTGHSYVNTPISNAGNKYYGPRAGGGAIREVTGPSGQVIGGRRGDVGTGNANPRNNTSDRIGTKSQMPGVNNTPNGGGVAPRRNETGASDARTDRPMRTTGTTPNNNYPTRTADRPAQNYNRPQRTTETAPSNDRPARTYDRPAPNYNRPQRSASPSYDRPQRSATPSQAPRQESRSYSPSSSPAPARSSGGGGGGNSNGGGSKSSGSSHHSRG